MGTVTFNEFVAISTHQRYHQPIVGAVGIPSKRLRIFEITKRTLGAAASLAFAEIVSLKLINIAHDNGWLEDDHLLRKHG